MRDTVRCGCGEFLQFGTDGHGRLLEWCGGCRARAARALVQARYAHTRLRRRQYRRLGAEHPDRVERERAIIEAYTVGRRTLTQLGEEFHMTQKAVQRVLIRHDIARRPRGRQPGAPWRKVAP